MYITLDPYYNVTFYNECLNAMDTNNVAYNEYYLYKSKRFLSVLSVPYSPLMVNYDVIPDDQDRYIITKTRPLEVNDRVLLQRRNQDYGTGVRKIMYSNDALDSIRDYAAFIRIKNYDEGIELSRQVPDKVWYLGKYYGGRYKLALVTNKYFSVFIDPLIIKEDKESVIQFEQRLNYKVFVLKDKLIKFCRTPYFLDGKFYKPENQRDPRFIIQ